MLDTTRIRSDFPILARKVHDKPLVYLDNAATTQKPRQVVDALVAYYHRYNANIHRGIHVLAEEATQAYEDVREHTARFLHAPSHRTIVFTRNATESINLVANTWGRQQLKPGDEILLTEMEHHANIVPWQLIAAATGASLQYVGVTDDGRLKLDDLDRKLTRKTKLVALTQMSNVFGTIIPVQAIVERAHGVGARVLIDAAQSAPHLPIDVHAMDADFLVFSAHKMLGPTGVGVLYAKEELLTSMPPFLGGGEMISDVTLTGSKWNEVPWKFEAGTPNIEGVIGFGKALEYLERLGFDAIQAHERELTAYALERLRELPDVIIYGPMRVDERSGVIAFNLQGLHPHDVGTILDAHGVAIRAGHHCAKPLMRRLGVAATARASFYIYNERAEVDRLIDALQAVRAFFTRPSKVSV